MINETILNYRTTELIGKGGMAEVYKAVHTTFTKREVAIKILNPILVVNENIAGRFINEAKIMADLEHQHIVRILDFEQRTDMLAIIMEYLKGENLSNLIIKNGNLSEKLAISILSQALDAFSYAHQHGIVHRDVKPSNIYIETHNNNNVKILDFGIAKLVGSDANNTNTGSQMETPIYMSPEQVRDSKHIDHRSDIYSLGVVLYYMMQGKTPYDSTTTSNLDIYNKVINEPLPSLIHSQRINAIIEKATAKDPADRYQSCEEFRNALLTTDNSAKSSTSDDRTIIDNSEPPKVEATLVDNVKKETTQIDTPTHQKQERKTEPKKFYVSDEPNKKKDITHIIIAIIVFFVIAIYFLAKSKNSTTEINTPIYPEMVSIPGGTFQMGSNDGYDSEKPIHSVTVSSFKMSKYEVTFAQYDVFCEATNRDKPDDEGWGRASRPVINVSWEDVSDYCKWLSKETGAEYRLPTEAEWEYAAGDGSSHTKYAGTNSEGLLGSYAWYGNNSSAKNHPVGQKNSNKYGLYDMTGNVWEWCNDWYDSNYSSNSSNSNPQGPSSGSYRVNRGGSWYSRASGCRVTLRYRNTPNFSSRNLGFRIVSH